MTERMVKIIIGSFAAGSALAAGFFMLATKLDAQSTPALAVVHPRRYVNEVKIVATETLAVEKEIQPVSTTPYEDFVAKIDAYKQENTSTISVQFFGDIMLDRNVAKMMGKRGLDYLFEHIGPTSSKRLFGGADLLIANLEGPFATVRVPTSKSIAFRFDPALALQLQTYGFDAFSLANNHTLDMGVKNVAFTQKILQQNEFGFFGYQTKENDASWWVAEKGLSEKIAFVGFNNTDHPLNMAGAKKVMDQAKAQARYVFVFMHWGDEYKRISNQNQRTLAHWLIDNGATAVIGGHPHVIQEMEIYQGKPIYYSLGNFIFDQYFSKETQQGISVGFILQDGIIKEAQVFPFYSQKSQVYAMSSEDRENFFSWFTSNSRLK